MIKNVSERLEGIEPNKLIETLIDLLDNAEDMGIKCKEYLYKEATREQLLASYDKWQALIDSFYERYVK